MSVSAQANTVPDQPSIAVPATLDEALDPKWLSAALTSVSGGAQVTAVETVEVIRTVATKVRFAVAFDGSDEKQSFCLKGLLDVDDERLGAGL